MRSHSPLLSMSLTLWCFAVTSALAATPKAELTFRGHSKPVTALLVMSGGETIVSGDEEGEVFLWDAPAEAPKKSMKAPNATKITRLFCSTDGQRVAALDAQGGLTVWNVESGETIHTVAKHAAPIQLVAGNPTADKFLCLLEDQSLVFHNGMQPPVEIKDDGVNAIRGFGFLPSGDEVLIVRDRKPLETRTLPDWKRSRLTHPQGKGDFKGFWMSPDGKRGLYARGDDVLWIRGDLREAGKRFRCETSDLLDAIASPEGYVATGVNREMLCGWAYDDAEDDADWTQQTGLRVMRRPHPFRDATALAAIDPRRILVGRREGDVEVWRVDQFAPQLVDFAIEVEAEIMPLFREEKFEELDKRLAEMRAARRRAPEGWTDIGYALKRLAQGDELDLADHIELLERWRDARPESISAHAALAQAYTSWAWEARGSGTINTVTQLGIKLFTERLRLAQTVVKNALKLNDRDVSIHTAGVDVAKGLSLGKDVVREHLKQGQAIDPLDARLYFAVTEYYLPRWFGEQKEGAEVLKEAIASLPKADGLEMYFFSVWHARQYEGPNVVHRNWYDPELLREASMVMLKRYPHVPGIHQLSLSFARYREDRDGARLLIAAAGKTADPVWSDQDSLDSIYKWLGEPPAPEGVGVKIRDDELTAAAFYLDQKTGDPAIVSLGAASDGKHTLQVWRRDADVTTVELSTAPRRVLATGMEGPVALLTAMDESQPDRLSYVSVGQSKSVGKVFSKQNAVADATEVIVSADKNFILVASRTGKKAKIINARAPTPQTPEIPLPENLSKVFFAPDGGTIVAAPTLQSVQLLNINDGSVSKEIATPAKDLAPPTIGDFSGNGKRFVFGNEKTLVALDWTSGEHAAVAQAENVWGGPLAVSHYASLVAVASAAPTGRPDDFTVTLLDGATLEVKQRFTGHKAPVKALGFIYNDAGLVSVSSDGEVRYWNLARSALSAADSSATK